LLDNLEDDKMVNENETVEPLKEIIEDGVRAARQDGSPFVAEVVEEEEEEEVAEALMSLNDVKDRFVGIVDNARTAGLASVTSRGFAALEGFFGALAGDKERRPPKE